MGTIRINPVTVNETGSWSLLGGAIDAPSALSGVGGRLGLTFPPSGSYALDCIPGTTILIDGVPTLLADLPVGFHIVDLTLHMTAVINSPTHFTAFAMQYNMSQVYTNPNIPNGGATAPIDVTGLTPSDLYGDHFSLSLTTDGDASATINSNGFFITGTYDIQNFTFDLSLATQPVQQGTLVTITSDPNDPDHMELNQLTEIDIVQGVDLTPVTIVGTPTEFEIVFEIPDLSTLPVPNPQTLHFQAVGNGVQFSGSVPLGKLETILFRNAPGIYFLDKTATSDTLYDPDGGTINVPIPEPFFKTGFIGG
jgi:hypothetical protein